MSTKDEDYKSEELKQLAKILAWKSQSKSLMDNNGVTIVLPNDSHTPFAYHIANQYNSITAELKRYCIDQVYKGQTYVGPPELSTELAFDIVSPSSAKSSELRRADAEMVQVIAAVLKDCGLPSVVIKLSHYSLLQAILNHCNIPNDDQRSTWCRQAKEELKRVQFNRPNGFKANLDVRMKSLLNLLILHGNLDQVKTRLNSLPAWVGSEVASMADKAFADLEEILSNINDDDRKGYSVCIDLSVGLENYDNIMGFDGFLFRFVYQKYELQ